MPDLDYPITTGVRFLRQKQINFIPHLYQYEDHGGTLRASMTLGVPEHEVVKTLVFEGDDRKPFLVLMHGDREVSTKQLARVLNMKHVLPCDMAAAQRHTGYMVGGISPFGTRTQLPIYVEESILTLPRLFINGGRRGFLVEITPADLQKALEVKAVSVGIG